jgi:nitrogen fixation NifU-like protein
MTSLGILERKSKSHYFCTITGKVRMGMYQQQLMDHYKFPRNRGMLSGAHFRSQVHNPSCGDSVEVMGMVEDTQVTELRFQGTGCVISQATASLLLEKLQGSSLQDIVTFNASDVMKLVSITLGPTRLKCALLPLDALHEAIRLYSEIKKDSHAQPCTPASRT